MDVDDSRRNDVTIGNYSFKETIISSISSNRPPLIRGSVNNSETVRGGLCRCVALRSNLYARRSSTRHVNKILTVERRTTILLKWIGKLIGMVKRGCRQISLGHDHLRIACNKSRFRSLMVRIAKSWFAKRAIAMDTIRQSKVSSNKTKLNLNFVDDSTLKSMITWSFLLFRFLLSLSDVIKN